MTKRLVRLGRCFRCLHVWRMRRRRPNMCPRCKSKLYGVPAVRPVKIGSGLGIAEVLRPHRDRIIGLANKAGAEAVWVFGSIRRGEATETSDVDLLVRWAQPPSLLDKSDFIRELETLLGRKVDIVSLGGIHWGLAPQIEFEAVPL